MTIRLYGTRLSPYVEKVARAIELKGQPFEVVSPRSPLELKRLNPQTSKMPVVDFDAERFYDSTFILRELETRYPQPPLLDSGSNCAAAQRLLEDWCDESLYWHVMALRACERNAAATVQQVAGVLAPWARPVAKAVIPRQLAAMTRAQGFGRLPYEILVEEMGLRLDDLVHLLAERDFFYSDRPSIADLAVYAQLHTARSGPTPECESLISHRPALLAHCERVEEVCFKASAAR
ncbi:MAG: glutathione S-transferase family protein [Deltaproteobacteria bacterium]|nr:glutathione S-transferase family protein [Deltaproteobacteria bacterium]MBW2420326.1 glutathione S-transferase family protein [Deltaproteobacteria bacterium]